MEAKDTKAMKANQAAFNKREKLIANQWREFSQTEAYKDMMEYAKGTSDMLTAYAKEGVMPSPIKEGEEMILTNEKALNLLQNARGCDIVVTYVEGYSSRSI